ncbi:MAG: pyridoxal-dependent decarboxylase [Eubacteriales bacterium]|nr:pyridoxal-dependent decarboxylase [Eubacteriales bacterium]
MERKTPYYVIDQKSLDDNFEKLERALKKHWSNFIIGYSYKTNALPWIIRHFDRLGCYAEVVSEEEYRLAKLVGVKKGNLIYNGPIKTKETFLEAIRDGCIVNIDSEREIDWLDELPRKNRVIGIRVNFDIERMCPGQSQCPEEGGRFGFCYENGEFSKAVTMLQEKGARVSGLHLHTSSKSRGLDIYRAIAMVACDIQKEFRLDLDYVDVGGGFFGGLPTKPQFDEYIALMADILSTQFDKGRTSLIIEPGMAVIGAPVRYVTTVIDVKDTQYNRFVVTDGSRTSIDPLMSKSSYFHSYERSADSSIVPKQIICGYTCMEHDRLFEAIEEPALLPGDRIIYDKVGAYTMCLTPLFIKYFPDVYVERDGVFIKVREAWRPEDYLMKSILEE